MREISACINFNIEMKEDKPSAKESIRKPKVVATGLEATYKETLEKWVKYGYWKDILGKPLEEFKTQIKVQAFQSDHHSTKLLRIIVTDRDIIDYKE